MTEQPRDLMQALKDSLDDAKANRVGRVVSGGLPASPPADIDLAAIKARVDAATDGPWHIDESPGFEYHVRTGGTAYAIPSTGEPVADAALDADAEFIAHARSDVPVLLAEVERLRALVAAGDTDETTLRTRIAEQIRALNTRIALSPFEVREQAARIAEGAGS